MRRCDDAAVVTHWPEYAAEAFGLGLFMLSACGFAVLLFHPASPGRPLGCRACHAGSVLMGLAMGLTLLLNIYSPWGRRSGAHLNPAVTLTFFRLGKVAREDIAGLRPGAVRRADWPAPALAVLLFRPWLADPSVNYVATVPGPSGIGVAFAGGTASSPSS